MKTKILLTVLLLAVLFASFFICAYGVRSDVGWAAGAIFCCGGVLLIGSGAGLFALWKKDFEARL